MKKFLVFLVTTFLTVGFSHAENNPKVKQFLEKVNLYYYCLNRKGLQNFSCETRLNLPQLMEQVREKVGGSRKLLKSLHDEKYYINYDATKGLVVSAGKRQRTKNNNLNLDLDQVYKSAVGRLGTFLRFFNSLNIHPLFTDADLSKTNYEIQTKSYGFDVNYDETEISFDKNVRLIPPGGPERLAVYPNVQFGFSNTRKGLLLISILDRRNDGSDRYEVNYEDVNGFKLPKKLTIFSKASDPWGNNLTFIFYFSNYKFN